MSTVEKFRLLERTVIARRENLQRFLPPGSEQMAHAACTPGNNAHALMKAICMVLASELEMWERT